ncbi:MAG: reprolysin-like metallopeptidase [Planctomycetota bacterium]
MREMLSRSPTEAAYLAGAAPVLIDLPMPDGSADSFAVFETPMLAPELAAKFPQIRTYAGESMSDPTAIVRVTVTELGVDAFVMREGPDVFIDRFSADDPSIVTSYYALDVSRDTNWVCGFDADAIPQPGRAARLRAARDAASNTGSSTASAASNGPVDASLAPAGGVPVVLRTFSAAVSTTGEYTQFFGGTVSAGLSAVTTAMNRVSGVYERELATRLQLVADNDQIIFTNPATDPYGSISLNQINSVINARIGSANYDVGHLVDTGAGGFAQLAVVCTGSKASGYTGLTPPTGDPFFIDYLSHELGHQFNGLHTFNGNSSSCAGGNRSGSAAYEPGSGSTIMGYAGICGNDNIQNNSDDYFNWKSLIDMSSHIASRPCDTETSTGNTEPVASVVRSNIVVPISTPFRLIGASSDAESDAVTYTWEQADLGPQRDVSASDNGSSPIFRSFEGTSNPERIFPRLTDWRDGSLNRGEQLPTVPRTLDFRLTVRDNNPAGGGYDFADADVTVIDSAGPFRVTSQSSPTTITDGQLTVTWDVAGTDSFPILASQVNVLFSADGASTFPFVLASGIANDGSATVTLPAVITGQGYVMVESEDGAFLDINKAPITLDIPPEPVTVSYPDGLPSTLEPDVTTPLAIRIDPGSFTLSLGSLRLFYGIDSPPGFLSVPITSVGGDDYVAQLPPVSCDQTLNFLLSLPLLDGSPVFDPTSGSYSATVVCDAPCPADVNLDGDVTDSDFFAWVTAFTASPRTPEQEEACDVNRDGSCTDSDFFAWVTIFTGGCV